MIESWADIVNGLYEFGGSVFILLHCRKLLRDKKVRGVSVVGVVFFWTWGLWNLYYYPSLGQWTSFVGGVALVVTNALWIGLMFYYIKREAGAENIHLPGGSHAN